MIISKEQENDLVLKRLFSSSLYSSKVDENDENRGIRYFTDYKLYKLYDDTNITFLRTEICFCCNTSLIVDVCSNRISLYSMSYRSGIMI